MKIAFYFCTRSKEPKKTLAYRSLEDIKNNSQNNFEILYSASNTAGLSINYNNIIAKYQDDFDYIIFLHDDVYVDDFNICNKLIKAHKQYDIVGLAGGINPVLQEPVLWHLMCGGFQSKNLRGAVAHYALENTIFMTSFGPTPSRVVILDGLFLSLKMESVKNSRFKFNENYTFHHYDIASCLDANSLKLKLGVYPIWVIHNSPGLLNPNDKLFLASEKKFINEYSGT